VPIAGHHWAVCVHGVLANPYWLTITDLYGLSLYAPIAGWPDSLPAGIVAGLRAIRAAKAEAEAEAERLRQMTRSSGAAPGVRGNWRG